MTYRNAAVRTDKDIIRFEPKGDAKCVGVRGARRVRGRRFLPGRSTINAAHDAACVRRPAVSQRRCDDDLGITRSKFDIRHAEWLKGIDV
jgi:hypothetical protein